jgi:hypothetical protein
MLSSGRVLVHHLPPSELLPHPLLVSRASHVDNTMCTGRYMLHAATPAYRQSLFLSHRCGLFLSFLSVLSPMFHTVQAVYMPLL